MNKTQKSGQGMVEYSVIVAIIALAAIAVCGVFGDTIRAKVGGGVTALGGDPGTTVSGTTSENYMKALK